MLNLSHIWSPRLSLATFALHTRDHSPKVSRVRGAVATVITVALSSNVIHVDVETAPKRREGITFTRQPPSVNRTPEHIQSEITRDHLVLRPL